jgi:primosomal protein N' (replication factor Y)
MVCAECGGTRMSVLRAGVSKVREELEALAGTTVYEVSGASTPRDAGGTIPQDARVIVGTEAVLHRLDRSDAVLFLDFDSELMAPRLRAGEEALALIARAARLVSRSHRGSSAPPGAPLVVQTRMPEHPAIQSAVRADPSILEQSEREVRTGLRLPPFTALARISGASADAYVSSLQASAGAGSLLANGVEIHGPHEGEWRVVGQDHKPLCDFLGSVPRPGGRLRIEVDPVRA